MTTTTLTGQQQAVAVLARILATPGLADATWTIYPDAMCGSKPEIHGQIHNPGALDDARIAVDAYWMTFDLALSDDKFIGAVHGWESFTKVEARGVVDGVCVQVWAAADREAGSC